MASSSVAAAGAAAGTHKKALIVHPQWHHTLQHDPLALSFWEQCCDAVLTKIAADCATEPRTLAALMAVNTRCRRIAAADELWRVACIARFNTPPDLKLRCGCDGTPMTWHDVFRFNQEAFQWLLAQTAAEAMAKLGIRPASNAYSLSAF